MTIAPERKHTSELIAAHPEVTFMIGHSATTCRQVQNAPRSGAVGFTRLYNTISQHLHRYRDA